MSERTTGLQTGTEKAETRPLPGDDAPPKLSGERVGTGGHGRRTAQIGGHGAKLPRQREAAIAALLAEPSIEAAAKAAGVADSTLRRWLQDADFRREYDAARRSTLDNALRDMQRNVGAAAGALRGIVDDESKPAAARVSAARTIIDAAFRGADLLDVTERIAKLEAKADAILTGKTTIPPVLLTLPTWQLQAMASECAERRADGARLGAAIVDVVTESDPAEAQRKIAAFQAAVHQPGGALYAAAHPRK